MNTSYTNGRMKAENEISKMVNSSLMHKGKVVFTDGDFRVEELSPSDHAVYKGNSLLARVTSLEYAKEMIAKRK